MLRIEDNIQWDIIINQEVNETFLSWFSRIAKSNAANPSFLIHQMLQNRKLSNFSDIETNNLMYTELIENLEKYIDGLSNVLNNENQLIKFENMKDNILLGYDKEIKYCNMCLSEDKTPYFRKTWQYNSINICFKHNVVLSKKCPWCLCKIKYWMTTYKGSILDCWNCKLNISSSIVNPQTIDPLVIEFQLKLMEIYNNGYFEYGNINMEVSKFVSRFTRFMRIVYKMDHNEFLKFYQKLSVSEKILVMTRVYFEIASSPRRLENPYHCNICDSYYYSQEELNHDDCQFEGNLTKIKQLQEISYQDNSTDMDVAKFRHLVVTSLTNYGTSAESVRQMGRILDIGASTIWRWIKRYREYRTVDCLKNNYRSSGRTPLFPRMLKESYYEVYLSQSEDQSLKQIYNDHTEMLKSKNSEYNKYPSYATVRRYILTRCKEDRLTD